MVFLWAPGQKSSACAISELYMQRKLNHMHDLCGLVCFWEVWPLFFWARPLFKNEEHLVQQRWCIPQQRSQRRWPIVSYRSHVSQMSQESYLTFHSRGQWRCWWRWWRRWRTVQAARLWIGNSVHLSSVLVSWRRQPAAYTEDCSSSSSCSSFAIMRWTAVVHT